MQNIFFTSGFFRFIFALVFFISFQSHSQNKFSDSVFSSSESIYNFRFSEAEKEIAALVSTHSGDFLSHLLSANFFWWKIITGEDSDENRKNYYSELEISGNILNSKDRIFSNDTLYALITNYAYKARIHSMNNQYFSALAQLNNSIDYVKQSFGKEKEYEWFYLTSGLYNYYIIATRKNYPFLIPYLIFLPDGNSETGIEFLKKANASENFLLKTEAEYFLLKLYLEEEKNYGEARKFSTFLLNKFPENLLYRYYHFKTFLMQKNISEASKELGLMKYYAEKNSQLSQNQKTHFLNIAKEDLKKYYSEKK